MLTQKDQIIEELLQKIDSLSSMACIPKKQGGHGNIDSEEDSRKIRRVDGFMSSVPEEALGSVDNVLGQVSSFIARNKPSSSYMTCDNGPRIIPKALYTSIQSQGEDAPKRSYKDQGPKNSRMGPTRNVSGSFGEDSGATVSSIISPSTYSFGLTI